MRFRTRSWSACSTGAKKIEIFAVALFIAALPHSAHAQVVISEAMYDPPGSDTGAEWIELFNAGASSVDLTKWKFNDGGSSTNHAFNVPPKNGGVGSITIAPGAYILVADNATNTAALYPSVANVIDSVMSMPDPNKGVSITLTLLDDAGASEDTFVYTGGTDADNKGSSVQRVSVSGSSVEVGAPTPGTGDLIRSASNNQTNASSTATTSTQTTQQTQTIMAPVSSYVPPPVPQLFADGGDDRTVIVGADVEFDGRAYDRKQNPLDTNTTRFMWNFGDGSTAEGPSVLHHFDYPGRYAVVFSIANDRFSISDTIAVTGVPAALHFSALPDGTATIQNHSGRNLDLSHWIIRERSGSFSAQFMLPEHSVVLSGETMRIGSATLKFRAGADSELDYPNGVEAIDTNDSATTTAPAPVYAPNTAPPAPAAPSFPTAPIPRSASQNVTQKRSGVSHTPTVPADRMEGVVSTAPAPSSSTAPAEISQAAGAGLPGSGRWWWIGAAALALLGGGAMFFSRASAKHEWDIIVEEKSE